MCPSKDTEGEWGFEYKHGTDLTVPKRESCLFLGLNRLELVNNAQILEVSGLAPAGVVPWNVIRDRFTQVPWKQTCNSSNSLELSFSLAPLLPRQITICTWGRKHREFSSFPEKNHKHTQNSCFPPALGWIFHFNQCQAGHTQDCCIQGE